MPRTGRVNDASRRPPPPGCAARLRHLLSEREVQLLLLRAPLGQRRHALVTGDAMVAITFAPYTPATVELATYAREHGIPVIAITDTLASPLRRLDATALCVSEIDVGAFRALSATLSLATTLVVAIGARRS